MKLHFDPNLDYQVDAIQAVVRLFEGGKPLGFGKPQRSLAIQNGAVPNELALTDAQLLANLQAVQQDPDLHNGSPLPVSPDLATRDFSIEMETGTGKTYVYLRTLLELNRAYGFRKFIVVVPSVAIREGVLKTLRITREHFARLFDNVPYCFYKYDSGNLARLRPAPLRHAGGGLCGCRTHRDAHVARVSVESPGGSGQTGQALIGTQAGGSAPARRRATSMTGSGYRD